MKLIGKEEGDGVRLLIGVGARGAFVAGRGDLPQVVATNLDGKLLHPVAPALPIGARHVRSSIAIDLFVRATINVPKRVHFH